MTLPVPRRLAGLAAALVGSALLVFLPADAKDVYCKDVHATATVASDAGIWTLTTGHGTVRRGHGNGLLLWHL